MIPCALATLSRRATWVTGMAMTTRSVFRLTAMGLLLLGGCAKKTAPAGDAAPPSDAPPPAAERETLSAAACTEKGGQVIGDIGDGAIHRPDYRCASGLPPIADIRPSEGEPVAVEGSVCCPDAK